MYIIFLLLFFYKKIEVPHHIQMNHRRYRYIAEPSSFNAVWIYLTYMAVSIPFCFILPCYNVFVK